MELDSRIKHAKKRNALVFTLLGIGSAAIIVIALLWIFLIKGYLLVVAPEDAATIYTIEIVDGIAFDSGNSLYVVGAEAEVKVSAPTFKSVSVIITPSSPQNIEVVLPPQPAKITATIDAEQETSWFINNSLVFVGNALNYELAHGAYTLRADNPFYEIFETSIDLERAQIKLIEVAFEPVQGFIFLRASQPTATASIEDKTYNLPLQMALSGGEYNVQITAPGFQTVEDAIMITNRQPEQIRNYNLIPQQASLDISLKPATGTLLVNGAVRAQGRVFVDANKDIDVRYSKPGYYDFQQTIKLVPKEQKPVNIELKPAIGNLTISSNLPADVFVNGAIAGKTPLQLSLPAIEHKIEIRKAGYRTQSRKVSVTAEQSQALAINLLTEYEARLAEGKQSTAQRLGIQMRNFKAEMFVMGSPVNQPGRRRNEHEVTVSLTKPFAVSVHEITEAQFAAYEGKQVSSQKPKTNVTWIEAAKFCNWLSQQDGLPVFYQIAGNRLLSVNTNSTGYRLPTEAEWEWLGKKANRQVATTYVWGNGDTLPKDVGNFADKSRQGTQPIVLEDYDDGKSGIADVGSFRADRIGLYDLAGNVSEWVHDRYTNSIPDLSQTYVDYLGPAAGELHVTKGGNFTTGKTRDLRVAYREPAGEAKAYIGFRIARYIE